VSTPRVRSAVRSTLACVSLLRFAAAAAAEPTTDEVLSTTGFSASEKQRVLGGEFVTKDVSAVSDRDLSVSMAFLIKEPPANLAKKIVAGDLVTLDPQVKTHGRFSAAGSPADIAALEIGDKDVQALGSAAAGTALNLSNAEIAAFKAASGREALQKQLQAMLLGRYQGYRKSGLAGIAPYDRGSGNSTDVAGELRKASTAATGLQKFLPHLYQALADGGRAAPPGIDEDFRWARLDIDGTPTYVLTHILSGADGGAHAVVQRQYYVSTGYNCEQAVAGFLPVSEGTLVVYTNRTFTDQVAGTGGSFKRNIGRRMLSSKLKEIFEAAQQKL
jgi:hypothetical protein